MNSGNGFAVRISLIAIACLTSVALSGCETPRWSKQWAGIEQFRVPEVQRALELQSRTVSVQAYGMNGFRFGMAGASAVVEIPASAIGWNSSAFRVVAVRLAGASDGLEGFVYTNFAGRSFLLARLSRLTVREWKEQPLLLETVAPAGYGLVLPPNATAFDLDLGQDVEISSGVAAYQCVSAQARDLANAELIRAAKDRDKGRITAKDLEYVQDKVSGMLASSAPACR